MSAEQPRERVAHAPKRPVTPPRTPTQPGRALYPTLATAVLPSGLRVLLEQDMYAQAVGVVSVIRGGTTSDPEGAEGMAHLVEHLTFRAVDASPETPLPLDSAKGKASQGTTRREKLIRYASTQNNCLTSPDAITCFEFGSPARLSWLIELEAERLAHPLAGIDEATVALERRIIASETDLRDDPRTGMWAARQIFPLLFPHSHPYARTSSASAHHDDRLTLAGARAYVAKNFRPERMTLLVTAPSGSTDMNTIIDHLPKALVGDKQHPVVRARETQPPFPLDMESGPVVRRTSPLPTAQVWLGWTLPGWWGALSPSEALLTRWVQQDLDLEQLRQEDPHIRHVRAALLPGEKATALVIRVLVEEGADAERVAQVVSGRVSSLWTREPAERELLTILKAMFDAEVVLDEPPQFMRSIEQAQMAAFNPEPALRSLTMATIRSIATSDLAKFAYDQLGKKRPRSFLFTPAEVADRKRQASTSHKASAARADDLFANAAEWDPMALPGTVSPVNQVVLKKLPTGLTVIVARRPAIATTAWLGFRGGYADAATPLLVELALRTRPDFTDASKFRTISDRGSTRDASIDMLEFRPTDLEPALGMLFKKATLPVQKWPTHDGLDRLLAYVHADLDDASEKAALAFGRALFGEHPMAKILSITDLAKVTRSDVDSWVGRVHNLRNAALVVVGDVDAAQVERYATTLSGKFGAPAWVDDIPAIPPPVLRPPTAGHMTTVITPRAGVLTEIRMGCLLPPMPVSAHAAYEMLRLTIQERLSTALRFERGEGYGVQVSLESLRGGTSSLQISTFLDSESLPDALANLRTQWRRWSQAGFDSGEMNVARWLYTGELSLNYSSGNAIAYQLFNEWNTDPTAAGRNNFRSDPMAIDLVRLNEIFATCKANAVLGLTGHEATIRKALRQSWPQVP
jgi:zinc protease